MIKLISAVLLVLQAQAKLAYPQVSSPGTATTSQQQPAPVFGDDGLSCYAYRDTRTSRVALQIDDRRKTRGWLVTGTCTVRFYSGPRGKVQRDKGYALAIPGDAAGKGFASGKRGTILTPDLVESTSLFQAIALKYKRDCVGCTAASPRHHRSDDGVPPKRRREPGDTAAEPAITRDSVPRPWGPEWHIGASIPRASRNERNELDLELWRVGHLTGTKSDLFIGVYSGGGVVRYRATRNTGEFDPKSGRPTYDELEFIADPLDLNSRGWNGFVSLVVLDIPMGASGPRNAAAGLVLSRRVSDREFSYDSVTVPALVTPLQAPEPLRSKPGQRDLRQDSNAHVGDAPVPGVPPSGPPLPPQ